MHQFEQALQGDDLILADAHVALDVKPPVLSLEADGGGAGLDSGMIFDFSALRPLHLANVGIVLHPLHEL